MAEQSEQGGVERLRAAVAAVTQTAAATAAVFQGHANELLMADHEVREQIAQHKAELVEVAATLAGKRAELERATAELGVLEGKRQEVANLLRLALAGHGPGATGA